MFRGRFSFGLAGHGIACEGIRAFVLWMPGMPFNPMPFDIVVFQGVI